MEYEEIDKVIAHCARCENEVINPAKSKREIICKNCQHFAKFGESLFTTQQRKQRESQQRAKERQKAKPIPQYKQKTIIQKPKTPIKIKPQNPLDAIFSKIIRKVHLNHCHSCGQFHKEQDLQCGHYIGRSNFSTRYDLKNALPVCMTCNYYDASHVEKLGLKLIELYGENVIDELNIKKIESPILNKSEKEILFKSLSILYNSLTDCKELNFEKIEAFLNLSFNVL